jgi:hypothetical protein
MKTLTKILLCAIAISPTGDATAQSVETNSEEPQQPKQTFTQPLLREGFMIADRKAKLVRHSDDLRWFLLFEPFIVRPTDSLADGSVPDDGKTSSISSDKAIPKTIPSQIATNKTEKPEIVGDERFTWVMQVLPGKWLTVMNNITGDNVNLDITFRVWGEVTTYKKRNFFLPNMVAIESLFGEATDSTKTAENGAKPPKSDSDKPPMNPTDQTKKTDNDLQENKLAIAERLRKVLLTIPRTHVLEVPDEIEQDKEKRTQTKTQTAQKRILTSSGPEIQQKDGDMIIDRVGRLVFDIQQECFKYEYIFESDGVSLNQQPVVLHPNRLLEEMEERTGARRQVKFRVTGQISKYKKKDYMLLRKIIILPSNDMGNLGK